MFDERFTLVFSDEINKSALKGAVEKALELFPEFAVRPVIKDNQVYYEENHNPVPVFDENRIRCYGTDDTYGYLFAFVCEGNSLVCLLSWYCGCNGVLKFVRTFLVFLCTQYRNDYA